MGGSGVIFQRLAQVQKAAAFRHGGQAALHGGVYGAAHGGVGRQLGGVQLRVAARQVQPADMLRRRGIPQRAEIAKLCACGLQAFQRFGIGKAERFILCHGNAHGGGCGLNRRGHWGRAVKQGQQPRPVDIFMRGGGQNLNFLLQISNFARGFQPQVAAFDGGIRQGGQKAHHRQAGFPFQHGGQQLVQHLGAVVQQNARNVVRRAERF